ncbi:MAG: thiamine-phosphate pyrophosphorylase [Candidatus Omnitrophota bacterium]
MPKVFLDKKILRLIDANLNRIKEGIRVLEDINRFVLDDKCSSGDLKKIRHHIFRLIKSLPIRVDTLIYAREIESDVGRPSIKSENKRRNLEDIFCANVQRIKESLRVLEEFSKLFNAKIATEFKFIRYKVYGLEKKTIKRIRDCK